MPIPTLLLAILPVLPRKHGHVQGRACVSPNDEALLVRWPVYAAPQPEALPRQRLHCMVAAVLYVFAATRERHRARAADPRMPPAGRGVRKPLVHDHPAFLATGSADPRVFHHFDPPNEHAGTWAGQCVVAESSPPQPCDGLQSPEAIGGHNRRRKASCMASGKSVVAASLGMAVNHALACNPACDRCIAQCLGGRAGNKTWSRK